MSSCVVGHGKAIMKPDRCHVGGKLEVRILERTGTCLGKTQPGWNHWRLILRSRSDPRQTSTVSYSTPESSRPGWTGTGHFPSGKIKVRFYRASRWNGESRYQGSGVRLFATPVVHPRTGGKAGESQDHLRYCWKYSGLNQPTRS